MVPAVGGDILYPVTGSFVFYPANTFGTTNDLFT